MNAKRISGALMVSLVIHGIIMLIASAVYIAQTVRFIECYGDRTPNRKDAVSVEIFSIHKNHHVLRYAPGVFPF